MASSFLNAGTEGGWSAWPERVVGVAGPLADLAAPYRSACQASQARASGFEVALAPGDVAGGPVVNADVEHLDATRATLLAAGATERSTPREVAPEVRVCVLADADGNPIGLRGR